MTKYRSDHSRPVRVHEDTYERLKARKRPGDSFSDVVERLLDEYFLIVHGEPDSALATLEALVDMKAHGDRSVREVDDDTRVVLVSLDDDARRFLEGPSS